MDRAKRTARFIIDPQHIVEITGYLGDWARILKTMLAQGALADRFGRERERERERGGFIKLLPIVKSKQLRPIFELRIFQFGV